MTPADPTSEQGVFIQRTTEAAIRIGLLVVIVVWCYRIVAPFVLPVLWGIIIAIAAKPAVDKLTAMLGGRPRLAALVFTLLALALLLVPTILLSGSVVEGARPLVARIMDHSITIPPPSERVRTWPVIGERSYAFWQLASENLQDALQQIAPHLKAFGGWLLSVIAGLGVAVVQFVLAIVIAGVLLANPLAGKKMAQLIGTRLVGARGSSLVELAGATIRSVAQGVLGIALIQGGLAGLGMLVVGVPAAGVWALFVLFLAVVQLPTLIILGPVIVYVLSTSPMLPAVLFMIWALLVGLLDNVLKPLMLGRGLAVPMLVILLGAIGGMILEGIIGLFIGAVVLAIGYTLFTAWVYEGVPPEVTLAPGPSDTQRSKGM